MLFRMRTDFLNIKLKEIHFCENKFAKIQFILCLIFCRYYKKFTSMHDVKQVCLILCEYTSVQLNNDNVNIEIIELRNKIKKNVS